MENKEINLAWMYPDILNLHGERGNAQAFKNVANELGIELSIERIDDIEAKIEFDKYDIMLFNCGELRVVPTMIEFLKPQLKQLKKYIKDNKVLISVGTSSAFLCKKTIRTNGEEIEGLGILNMEIKERNMVLGDDILFQLEDGTEIVGSQIQMVDVIINDEKPLGRIKYGYGNNGSGDEGCKNNNVIFTNCLGPLFVKNPWFAEKILREICNKKQIPLEKNTENSFEIEKKSLKVTKDFIESKMKKDTK